MNEMIGLDYHKILKEIRTIINVQKQVQDIIKITREINIIITEMENTILKISINNQTINATNILEVLKDL